MQSILTTLVAVLVGLNGCNSSAPPAVSPTTSAQRWTTHRPVSPPESEDAAPGATLSETPSSRTPTQSFNTGDCDTWPHYDLPFEFQIDTPPVPEQLTAPAPALSAP